MAAGNPAGPPENPRSGLGNCQIHTNTCTTDGSPSGTLPALSGIVKSTRAMLSAIVLIAAVITSTGASALAVQAHPSCATHRHECGKIARITKCCDDQDAARTDSTPVQPRVEVRPDLSAAPALPSVAPFAEPQLRRPVQPSPPRLCLLDLPTLYATFLI